jgi:hypothetical protein
MAETSHLARVFLNFFERSKKAAAEGPAQGSYPLLSTTYELASEGSGMALGPMQRL